MDKQQKPLRFSFILNNKPLPFVGKISYGVYLHHRILSSLTNGVLNKYLNNHLPLLKNLWFVLLTGDASYHFTSFNVCVLPLLFTTCIR